MIDFFCNCIQLVESLKIKNLQVIGSLKIKIWKLLEVWKLKVGSGSLKVENGSWKLKKEVTGNWNLNFKI